ncbi:MAG TPA: hypothetical protein VG165_13465 [Solirubrobacteraceae bacterium]|nr:hypothetical protein [Solirubrobacteraceae bacterium]
MSEFVDECRREWKRLRVPDPIANEMAADLAADLQEAEAEGASPEQVLGSEAFDPRSFAASWAAARGVMARPRVAVVRPLHLHSWPVRSAIAAGVSIATIFVGLAIVTVRRGSTSVATASPAAVRQPGPSGGVFLRQFGFGAGPPARLILGFGLVVLLVGIVGLVLWSVYWSPWADPIRSGRRRSSIDDGLGGPGF